MSVLKFVVSSFLFATLLINSLWQIAIALPELGPNIISKTTEPVSRQGYEGYYLYLGEHPAEENPGWDVEAQGLSHDHQYWFITQNCCLWRVPVKQDLSTVEATSEGVSKIEIGQSLPQFNHMGDLTYYAFAGKGFLIVPLEGPGQCGAIGIFDADTLSLIDWQCIPGQGTSSSWVAVNPSGILFSSTFSGVTAIKRYTVDWPFLKMNGKLIIVASNDISIFDEVGSPLALNGMQGGEISPSGELLYVMTSDGINVFDIATQRRIQRSTNGYGYFNYEFHPNCCKYEEPEGITLWDLDDGRAPGISGQLHAIMLDNDIDNTDDVYIKHYTSDITVDAARNQTITNANDFAWDGAIIRIQPGGYPETITLSKRVKLIAPAGGAQIGK